MSSRKHQAIFSSAGLVQYCTWIERACGGSSRTGRRCRAERIRCRLAESDGRATNATPLANCSYQTRHGRHSKGSLCRSRGVIGCPTALLIMPVLFGGQRSRGTAQSAVHRTHDDMLMLRMEGRARNTVSSHFKHGCQVGELVAPKHFIQRCLCLRHRRFDAALGRQSAKPSSHLPTDHAQVPTIGCGTAPRLPQDQGDLAYSPAMRRRA
jgi:hypothetical protein